MVAAPDDLENTSMLTLLINLDDATDRFANAAGALQREDIYFQRVEAVDGRGKLATEFPQYSERQASVFFGRPMTGGEIGCYLSHLNCLEIFLQSSAEYCLVLEDDMTLPDGSAKILAQLVAELNGSGCDWELVNLGKAARWPRSEIGSLEHYKVQHAHYFPVTTTGLLWTRNGAKALLDSGQLIYAPIDHFLRRLLTVRGTGIALSPALTPPSGASSTIDTAADNGSEKSQQQARHGFSRTPYFLVREFRRQSYNYLAALKGLVRNRIDRW